MDILDILFGVDDSVEWEETLNNIEEWVKAYYDAIARGERNPEAYLNEVLPEYWQTFRAHNTYRWGGVARLPSNVPYDVGIFLVGFSSLPIALSIAEIQPRQGIYFLHSADTDRKCDEIIDRIVEMLDPPPPPFSPLINSTDAAALITRVRDAERREIADPSDPVSTFRQIKDIIDQVGDDVKIALDLTGGKKTMIGGGFTAGSIYSVAPECHMFYVDSLEYDSRRGTPIPGTEFLSRLDNPYKVYNVQSVGQAKELFKRHNYEAAVELWDSVRDKLDCHSEQYPFLGNERQEAGEYYGSSHCYQLWDAFDYDKAVERKTYSTNGTVNSWGYDEQHVHRTTGGNTIDVLDILAEVSDKSTLYTTEYRVIHYAIDRYQNGMRRKRSGKLEDAIVRFTQVIEMLCNYKIYQIADEEGLVNQNGNIVDNITPDTQWRNFKLIPFLFGEDEQYERSYGRHYRFSNAGLNLNISNYSCETVSEITDLIEYRNDFIHFNSPMRQNDAEVNTNKLQELAEEFLENFSKGYCDGEDLSFDKLLKLHEFRQLQ